MGVICIRSNGLQREQPFCLQAPFGSNTDQTHKYLQNSNCVITPCLSLAYFQFLIRNEDDF